ncbi:hypothetical protein ONV78_30005 [Hahella sp. CR1]|nr:hypothetical protein [Hahella sp. CR1]MDG9672005.1 hypothetical protein [Hahella sp. CR1]
MTFSSVVQAVVIPPGILASLSSSNSSLFALLTSLPSAFLKGDELL